MLFPDTGPAESMTSIGLSTKFQPMPCQSLNCDIIIRSGFKTSFEAQSSRRGGIGEMLSPLKMLNVFPAEAGLNASRRIDLAPD